MVLEIENDARKMTEVLLGMIASYYNRYFDTYKIIEIDMVITIYLTFDLSFNGDYTGLYQWLDRHHALECGDSACRINYSVDHQRLKTYDDTQAILRSIKDDLASTVKFTSKDRVYVASLFPDDNNNVRLAGRFIIGTRKPNPWDGASGNAEVDMRID